MTSLIGSDMSVEPLDINFRDSFGALLTAVVGRGFIRDGDVLLLLRLVLMVMLHILGGFSNWRGPVTI